MCYAGGVRPIAAALILLLALAVPIAEAQPPPADLDIYLLVGQSNMFGTAALPAPPLPANQRAWMYDPAGWRLASDPLHGWLSTVGVTGAGVGPGMGFARAMVARRPGRGIGLVPCAAPGRIRDWQRDAAPLRGQESNYARCLRWAREASARGAIAGVLTYHGEADTVEEAAGGSPYPPARHAWGGWYAQMVRDLRADLGLPSLPAVHAQLATTTCREQVYWSEVKASQMAVALEGSSWIPTDDIALDHAADCLHHTADGYRAVGERFADAVGRAGSAPDPCTPRPPVRVEAVGDREYLRVAVTSGAPISALRFAALNNAAVEADRQPYRRPATHRLPQPATGATFIVRRLAPGPLTVAFVVTDACGEWPTFVGAGA